MVRGACVYQVSGWLFLLLEKLIGFDDWISILVQQCQFRSLGIQHIPIQRFRQCTIKTAFHIVFECVYFISVFFIYQSRHHRVSITQSMPVSPVLIHEICSQFNGHDVVLIL